MGGLQWRMALVNIMAQDTNLCDNEINTDREKKK